MDDWALATIAAVLLVYAATSGWLQRSYVSAAMFFVSAGLLAGPVLGLLDLGVGSEPIKLLAEVTLTLVLFADASRISLAALRTEFAVPARLLGIGLPLTIAAGAVAGVALLPGVGLAEAFLLAVILACTDAALGQAVVTDERLPSRIRQGLNVESGLNDGLCVPLFWIALGIAEADEGVLSDNAALQLVARGDRLRDRRRRPRRRDRRRRAADRYGSRLDRGPLGADPDRRHAFLAAGIATALHGSFFIAAFVGGLVFGSFRRAGGRRGDLSRRRGRRVPQRRDVRRLRRRDPRARARRDHVADRRLRAAQPHRRPDGAGGARACSAPGPDGRRSRSWAGSGRAVSRRSSSA